jgi:uncharacterized protein YhbP (UPF0306 family)
MKSNLNKVAKEIIANNQYLTLATSDNAGKPWVSIMAYTFDENYIFYFCSLPNSRHSGHIQHNSAVAFTIFDSQQPFGYGVGLQIEGVLTEAKEIDYPKILDVYLSRKFPYGNVNNDFMEGLRKLLAKKLYRFYQLEVTKCWINDPNADTDSRVEVTI